MEESEKLGDEEDEIETEDVFLSLFEDEEAEIGNLKHSARA